MGKGDPMNKNNESQKNVSTLKIIDYSIQFQIASAIVLTLTLSLVIIFDIFVYGLRVKGRSNLKPFRDYPCFLISNHSLYLDPAIVAHAIFPSRTFFSALEKTFYIPVLGQFIRLLGAFPIPSSNGLLPIVKDIKESLKRNFFVHFFPEGNLVLHNTKLQDFYDGVFYLSYLFRRPVIPVVIVSRPRFILGIELPMSFCRVRVEILPPIYPKRTGTTKADRLLIKNMADQAQKAMQSILDKYSAPRKIPEGK